MEWLNKLSPQQRAIADKVAAEADRQGVPRELALAAAMQESGFDQRKKSKTGPVGVMQLGRAAAADLGVNRYNLDQNIRGGVSYLKQNLAQQNGDPQRALIAYHDGPSSDFFKGGSMSPEAYNHLKMVRSYGGFQGDVIPMATAKQDNYPEVKIGEVEPLPDFIFSDPPTTSTQPQGFSTAAQIGSAGIGALVGMATAPSTNKQANINQSLIQATNAANVPISEANFADMQRYNDELEQRKRLLDAITEAQKSKGVQNYVESQLKGGVEDVVKQDPRVISTRTTQSVLPEYEGANLRAVGVNRGELVSDPNRFGGLSVPASDLAPPAPTPQELVTRQLGPEPTRPTPRPMNVPQVQPIRSMAAQGAATGALTGYSALRAAEAMRNDDTPQAMLGTVGTVSGAIANQARNPRVALPAALLSGASVAGSKALDYLRGEKKPQDKSVLNKAEGGLASLPKYAGRDPKGQLVGAAVKKGKELIGRESPSLFVPRQTQIMRMSEALGPHEGKYLGLTQTDNFGVHGGRMGGNQFPNFQNISPKHQEAGVVWMNDAQKHANDLVKGRRFNNKDVVYSTYIGGPDQLKSNKTVFNDILEAHYNRELTPEQYDLINQRIATLRKAPKKPLVFSQPFDIRDKFAVQELGGDTFEKRSALASMLGAGEGVGKTKGGIALPQYQDILRAHRDPLTEGVPTSSVGTRLFTVDDIPAQFSTEFHPDYNWAVFGKDQGVQFNPVPQRIAVPDWHGNYKERFPNKEPHGNAWFNYPKNPQFIDERYLTNMQKEGYAKGGLVNLQSGGNPKTALLKTLGNKVLPLVERDANLQKFLLPSQEKRRMYHGTTGDINKFNPNNNITFLTPEPTFANSFAAKSFDPVESQSRGPNPVVKPGANVMPVHVQAENIFNPYKPSHLDSLYDKLMQDYGQDLGSYNVRQMVHDVKNPYDNWQAIENDMVQKAIKELGHDSFVSTEAGVQNLGMYNPRKIKSAIGNEGTYNTNELDINKAKGGLVHLQSGGNPKMAALKAMATPVVDRLSMHFKDVTKRIPQLQEAAQRMKNGEPVTREEYEMLVNAYKPVKPFAFVPKPATKEEAINALTADKKGLFGAPSQILQPGQSVGLRLDIPAYSDHGVWVPAVHEKGTKAGAGTRVGYESVASVNNPVFNMSDKGALSIASGKPKSTIATIEGGWNPVDEQTAIANAQRYLEHPDWRQVGMDPERHGYFYDRASMEPVLSAEEALQIGPLVLARKPVYGKKEDFGFAKGGLVHMQSGGNPKAAALKAFADPAAKYLKDWSWKPMPEVAGKLDLRTVPDYIQGGYGQFMKDQARRAAAGDLNARDLIKAYTITQSSIGRGGLSHATATKAGLKLPNTGGEVRPEGAFAEWLGSPMGQRYLDMASAGQADPRALAEIQQQFAPFGKQNDLIEKMQYAAQTMPNLSQNLNQAVLGDKDAYRNWAEQMKGVAGAKSGFIGSMLGRGDLPTFDARQINLHTANQAPVGISSIMNRGKGQGGREAVDRLAARQEALGLELDPSLDPFYQHLTHHAVWDKVGNNQTTHDDLVKAMRNYKAGGQVGLYANIHAKRERIKQGSGEKMRKPGSEGAPTADAFRESAKTAKRK